MNRDRVVRFQIVTQDDRDRLCPIKRESDAEWIQAVFEKLDLIDPLTDAAKQGTK